ncbi:MAG: hypothetical protein P8X89_12505 [Reinekea sp.]
MVPTNNRQTDHNFDHDQQITGIAQPEGHTSHTHASPGDDAGRSSIRRLAAQDGHFYFLTDSGSVHRYDPGSGEILPLNIGEYEHITLGADKKPYGVRGQGIYPLDKTGRLNKDGQLNTAPLFEFSIPEENGSLTDLVMITHLPPPLLAG